jgi:hypothetical protein
LARNSGERFTLSGAKVRRQALEGSDEAMMRKEKIRRQRFDRLTPSTTVMT